jgi:hypothetical protein
MPAIHHSLDPGETLGELMFGIIMVLTFTMGARLLTDELTARELVIAALGCNIAWGIIDAVLFLLGTLYYRSQRLRLFRTLREARSDTEALKTIEEAFGLEDRPFVVRPADRGQFYQSILLLTAQAVPARVALTPQDYVNAFVIFVLVSATAVPGVIPFFVFKDVHVALRISNFVLILLLFIVGYRWAQYTDAVPWQVGLGVTLLGVSMVCVAIALGG